jgi:SAM-dependent methyltransferase
MAGAAAPGEPNAAQREHWAVLGRDWAAAADAMEHRLQGWGQAAMDHVGTAPGERVIDIGCGAGRTTLALAAAVGPGGQALGLGISASMIEEARRAGAARRVANVAFEEGDAQVYPFAPGGRELAFSRFGVMFFADPIAAFANIGAALRPGGRIGFVCWGPRDENVFRTRVREAVGRVLAVPVDDDGPGPHSLSRRDVLTHVLDEAGFTALDLQLCHRSEPIGATAPSAEAMVEELLMVGPGRDAVMRQPQLRPQLAAALMQEFGAEWKPGGLWLPGAAWLVAAVWPGR